MFVRASLADRVTGVQAARLAAGVMGLGNKVARSAATAILQLRDVASGAPRGGLYLCYHVRQTKNTRTNTNAKKNLKKYFKKNI